VLKIPIRGFEIGFDTHFESCSTMTWDLPVLDIFLLGCNIDLKAVGKAGLRQKLFRLLWVVRISSRFGVVAEHLRAEQAPQRIGVSFQHKFNNPVTIDGVSIAADFYIIQRFVSRSQP
jgi:hypothetical protein